MDDNTALNRIAELMDGREWSPDTLDNIADIVRLSGRKVRDPEDIADRLEYLRGEIRAERISWSEIAELQGLAEHITPGDVELLEWAGVQE